MKAPLTPKHGKGCLTRVLNTYQQLSLGRVRLILGDPGAISRVDKMSVVKVDCNIETSPWALFLIGQKKIFLANQRRGAVG